jgi:activating signal cointegrator complex subunit 1
MYCCIDVSLELHCTVVNTIHRKPRSKTRRRQPFSYSAVLASTAFQTVSQHVRTSMSKTTAAMAGRPVSVDFGVWDVDEIQICEMGSIGPEGEYISCGGCSLMDNV